LEAPTQLPSRAIVYSVTGEFAHESQWWMIDLDYGRVTLITYRWTPPSKQNSEEISKNCVLDMPNLLSARRIATDMWQSDLPQIEERFPAPGATSDTYIISAGRVAQYFPFSTHDQAETQEVERLIGTCPSAP
jgi:hypothetical protein